MGRVQPELPTARLVEWRLAIIMVIAGLILASYGACSTPAHADRLRMPVGWRVTISDADDVIVRDATLVQEEYIVDRKAIDESSANARSKLRLEQQLKDCTGAVEEVSKPDPAWHAAVWGALWGASIVGAAILGSKL